MAKKARVWTGTEFVELASAQTDLTAYSTTAQMNTAIAAKTGMTLLSTTTLSGASTTVSSIPQTYADLEIWIYGITNATANGGLLVAPNGLTTAVVATGHIVANGANNLANINGARIYSANSILRTDANNAFRIKIDNYASTTNFKTFNVTEQFTLTDSTLCAENYSGAIRTNTAITSLVISNNGGNWSTGTVQVWGL